MARQIMCIRPLMELDNHNLLGLIMDMQLLVPVFMMLPLLNLTSSFGNCRVHFLLLQLLI